jgi:hypothetical protein
MMCCQVVWGAAVVVFYLKYCLITWNVLPKPVGRPSSPFVGFGSCFLSLTSFHEARRSASGSCRLQFTAHKKAEGDILMGLEPADLSSWSVRQHGPRKAYAALEEVRPASCLHDTIVSADCSSPRSGMNCCSQQPGWSCLKLEMSEPPFH